MSSNTALLVITESTDAHRKLLHEIAASVDAEARPTLSTL